MNRPQATTLECENHAESPVRPGHVSRDYPLKANAYTDPAGRSGMPDSAAPDSYAVVAPGAVPEEPFTESGLPHRKLTDPLGATEMRVNGIDLRPGTATRPHAHERQEEIFVAIDDGRVEIDGETFDVPAGGVVRVDPEPTRSLVNDSDDEIQRWVAFGAPPVGTVEDFGEYVLPEE